VKEEGDSGERAGRWAGREEKTECGLHEDYFKMKHLVSSSSFVLALSMANLISIFRRNRGRKTELQL